MISESRQVPVERFLLRAVGRTDVGAQRTQNEDNENDRGDFDHVVLNSKG